MSHFPCFVIVSTKLHKIIVAPETLKNVQKNTLVNSFLDFMAFLAKSLNTLSLPESLLSHENQQITKTSQYALCVCFECSFLLKVLCGISDIFP